jgi:integrase
LSQVDLKTRAKRERLPFQHEPRWVPVERGVAIGYRRTQAGGVWYVRRFHAGKYHKRVLGPADDEHEADGVTRLSWRDALAAALDEPKRDPAARAGYLVRDAFEDYWRHREAKGRSGESLEFDRGKAAPFVEAFGGRRVAELTTAELKRWRDAQAAVRHDQDATEEDRRDAKRKAQATANRVWTVVRAALNLAFKSGIVDSDTAWRRVTPFANVDEARRRFLTLDEARRLLKGCAEDFRPFAYAALLTGLRLGELARLRVRDVEATRLRVGPGKGRERFVPLTTEGQRAFKRWTNGRDADALVFVDEEQRAWTRPKVSRRMAEACDAAKLTTRVTFHDLRRTYGSLLANDGARDAVIAAALGHRDTRMTRRHYAHLLDASVAAELEARLPRFTGRKRTRA